MEQENEKLIEQMMADVGQVDRDRGIRAGQVLNQGDEGMPAPTIITELKDAGYVYIYDTRTGDRSLCNRNMLLQHLKKKRPDGSLVFTTTIPKVLPKRGILTCMLHPNDANRKHYDELGLPVCMKDNLNSRFQVRRHMQKRHKVEWQTIEEERLEKEKQEDREFRQQLLGKAVEKAPLYVRDKDKEKQE